MDIIRFILNNSSTFLFVLVRTGSIILPAPVFGAVNVPIQVKAGLSFLIALVLTPLVGHVPMPPTFISLAICLAGELLLGAMIGFCIRLVFTGIEFAGQIASFQMGLGVASAYDPLNSAQMTVFGKLMSIITILIFLSVNGHLMIIMALKKSFDVIPPYGFHFSAAMMENFLNFSKDMFIIAVKFSAPVIAIMIFINVALGIMAKTVPQLNMFVVGFALTMTAGFLTMAMSMQAFGSALTGLLDQMWQGIFALLKVM